MRVLFSVLNRFVDVSDLNPQDVAERLTMAGLEVEGVEYLGDALNNCVVAVIEDVEEHPDSKKLKVLKVHTGREQLQVVCGAPNVEKGLKVALALPGARLPNGFAVEATHIRGVKSEGMLISEIELDLVEETWGILELPNEAAPGEPLARWVHMDDYVLEVSPTPNRGDCFGVLGVAREVAAVYGRELRIPPVNIPEELEETERYISVEIEEPDLCPRYTARYVEGVRVGESPLWLKVAVKAFGMRPISNVVDVTNYVLMELGHPLHAFDHSRLKDSKIVVRRAREGEYIVTLDGEYRELDTDTLVIADGQRPVAIAGVMGGANSEVAGSTTAVLLESAYFNPVSIRRTSKRLGLSTEASKRFERGTDIEGLVYASNRAVELILEVAGGKVSKGLLDVYPRPYQKRRVVLSFERLNNLLGVEVPPQEAKEILGHLGFSVSEEKDRIEVEVPPFRSLDITRDVDLVEEIARVWGYHRIPSQMPAQRIPHYTIDSLYPLSRKVRGMLTACGLTEVLNYSFISAQDYERLLLREDDQRMSYVELLNPLSEEMAVMRTLLLPGLIRTVQRNQRVRIYDGAFFEIGKVFFRRGEGIEEKLHCGIILAGRTPGHWDERPRRYDFYHAKGVLELLFERFGIYPTFRPTKEPFLHPGQGADVYVDGDKVGFVGVLHPDVIEAFELRGPVVVAEIDLEHLKSASTEVKYRPISKFPETTRDLSFIVPKQVPYSRVLEVIERVRPPELKEVKLIDVYRSPDMGEDRVSLTLSFTFLSHERTLSDEEVDGIFWKIAGTLEKELPITIRGKRD